MLQTVQESPIQPPAALVSALREMLRPLVRTLMGHGLSYPFLAALLKNIYVEVAEAEVENGEGRATDSQINLMTGVHRKDVRRLRANLDRDDRTPAVVTLGAQLALIWTSSRDYLDSEGKPRPLPRTPETPDAPSFDGLVESVSKDVRPRAVLDEWLRLGIARLDEAGRVCLNHDAFIPEKGFDEKAYFLGRNIRDHIAAATYNLAGFVPPMLERAVFYDRLSADSADELSEYARKIGMDTLLSMNREALRLSEADAKAPGCDHRISFGVYFYSVKEDPEARDNPLPDA
jgi:Family of unknown function (DUF6502)